jgi:hypothetical protein
MSAPDECTYAGSSTVTARRWRWWFWPATIHSKVDLTGRSLGMASWVCRRQRGGVYARWCLTFQTVLQCVRFVFGECAREQDMFIKLFDDLSGPLETVCRIVPRQGKDYCPTVAAVARLADDGNRHRHLR